MEPQRAGTPAAGAGAPAVCAFTAMSTAAACFSNVYLPAQPIFLLPFCRADGQCSS